MGRGLRFVPLTLLVVVLVELAVFVSLGRWVGFGWTLLLVLGTSMAGLLLLRREGVRAWRGFQSAATEGRPLGEQVANGLVGLLAGLLLAVPGVVTSLLGGLLLVPPLRRLARGGVRVATERRVPAAMAGDLFGPRRVRVHRGPAWSPPPGTRPDDAAHGPGRAAPPPPWSGPGGEVVEGEIVEPPSPR
jgi:UPF0716 protein FxsA